MATQTKQEPIDRIHEPIPIFIPIDESQSEKYEQVVTGGVNGELFQVKRGELVSVPFKVFEALYNSGKYPNL